jgi:hypothetical protein
MFDGEYCDDGGPTLIRVGGGLPSDTLHATIDGQHIAAWADESEAQFIDRCFALAIDRNAPFICLGGLPPDAAAA